MTTRRPHFDPRSFGRRRPFAGAAITATAPAISDDVKLFAITYAAGFIFALLYLL